MTADSSSPEMSAATKDVLSKVQRMIPPMLESFHKGSRTCVTTQQRTHS